MRYFKVFWTDTEGAQHFSAPLPTWIDAEMYRREIGGNAAIIKY